MLDTDLTSISTFGWFQETDIVECLTPISTFGWWFDVDEVPDEIEDEIYDLILQINRILHLELAR